MMNEFQYAALLIDNLQNQHKLDHEGYKEKLAMFFSDVQGMNHEQLTKTYMQMAMKMYCAIEIIAISIRDGHQYQKKAN